MHPWHFASHINRVAARLGTFQRKMPLGAVVAGAILRESGAAAVFILGTQPEQSSVMRGTRLSSGAQVYSANAVTDQRGGKSFAKVLPRVLNGDDMPRRPRMIANSTASVTMTGNC